MDNRIQVLFIHGGMTFKNNLDYLDYLKNREVTIFKKVRWFEEYIDKKLGNNFLVIKPRMPLSDNAKYEDWKIYFERFIPQLSKNIILIGASLGGLFLARYLSENKFPKKILSVYLIAAPYDDTLLEGNLVGGFKLPSDLSLIEKNCKNINLLFSEKDDVIPVSHAYKYFNKFKAANLIIYTHIDGHFKIPKFPEIIKMIKNDVTKI